MRETPAPNVSSSPWCGMAPASSVKLAARRAAVHKRGDQEVRLLRAKDSTVSDQVNHLVLQQEAKLVHSKVVVFWLISAQQFECGLGSSVHAHNNTIGH